jgi:hypothetical protein
VSGQFGSKEVNTTLLDLYAGNSTFFHYYSLFYETERMIKDEIESDKSLDMFLLRLPMIIRTLNFLLVILDAYLVVGTEIIILLSNPQKARKKRKY